MTNGSEARGPERAMAQPAPAEADVGGGFDGIAVATGGIAAPTEAPSLLQRQRANQCRERFLREYSPVGPTEVFLVHDLARHAAAAELWEEAAGAVARQAARGLPCVAPTNLGHGEVMEDAILATAMSPEIVARYERFILAHARAFYRALRRLLETQARRAQGESTAAVSPPSPFVDEAACQDYLRKRFEQGRWRCPRCGRRRGHYIKARRCWECAHCKRQAGLRAGTVAAESPLPLMTWFTAIRLLLWRPTIGAADLGRELGIHRATTVRNVARKIRVAMAEENASELLVGLDTLYARGWITQPESSAPEPRKPWAAPQGVESCHFADASPFDSIG